MSDWQLTGADGQVFHVPTGSYVIIGSGSPKAVAYQEFLDASGVPDGGLVFNPLADRQAQLKVEIDQQAQELARRLSNSELTPLHYGERLAEARLADVDGAIAAGEYPLLEAEVGYNGVDVAAVATNVLAEWVTLRRDLGTLETRRRELHAEVDAATTLNDLIGLSRGIYWPPFYPYLRRTLVTFEAVDFAAVVVPAAPQLEAGLFELVPIDFTLVFA